MTTVGRIEVSRAYEPRTPQQGLRVLVDRLSPRGLSKPVADLDLWCQDSAPSPALREWYGHAADRFNQFRDRYLTELDDPAHAEPLAFLHTLAGEHTLTLLTATKNLQLSHARVLAERLTWGHARTEPTLFQVHINQRAGAPTSDGVSEQIP